MLPELNKNAIRLKTTLFGLHFDYFPMKAFFLALSIQMSKNIHAKGSL